MPLTASLCEAAFSMRWQVLHLKLAKNKHMCYYDSVLRAEVSEKYIKKG